MKVVVAYSISEEALTLRHLFELVECHLGCMLYIQPRRNARLAADRGSYESEKGTN